MPRYLSPSSHQYCPPVSILFFEFYLTLSTNIGVSFEKSYFLFISARSFTFLALFFFYMALLFFCEYCWEKQQYDRSHNETKLMWLVSLIQLPRLARGDVWAWSLCSSNQTGPGWLFPKMAERIHVYTEWTYIFMYIPNAIYIALPSDDL